MVLNLRRLSRMSWRRIVLYGSAFSLFWIFVFSLTPITSPLPPYTGAHEVAILDLEVEVKRQLLHEAILKETGDKAFELSTLAVTLYYPSTYIPRQPRPEARPWLPRPISLIGTGYARLAHIYFPPFQAAFTFVMWLLGSKTVIPGVVDAPLLSSSSPMLVDESGGSEGLNRLLKHAEQTNMELKREAEIEEQEIVGGGELPCAVFTHGMAGMSQSYSHYLGSIASHGYVVAAIEHRDGSGPGSIVHFPDEERTKTVWHVQLQDLAAEPPMNESDLKVAQLAFREAEIQETIRLFKHLNAGRGATIENLKPDSPRSALPGFKDRLDMSAVTVIGHSYGATGAMQALKNAPGEEMPINGGIALDPGKGSGPLNEYIDVPLLVMQSGEWTEKQTEFYGKRWHFDVVKEIVQTTKKGWFMTLTGSAHPSCTDAPLIVPWVMRMVTGTTLDAKVALREYIDVSVDFLNHLRTGEARGAILKSEVTSPNGPLGDAQDRGKLKGNHGADWEIHVVPSA
ncbi:platelet-activating factor acetylhydrolase, isoform II-domain-containing protein [Lophiotrema nucula]|uniref:Putative phospholipase n=1 Tax=Lophiotrema nucula TaxID=690887 RepID=A0A6A5YZG2_9PLEO|nr:platelet-activating factor acetylhydrolase, isoform II-domain-containing protein [Lophiotrema nucula]